VRDARHGTRSWLGRTRWPLGRFLATDARRPHLRQQYEHATDHLQQALRLARTTGHHPGELQTLAGLADIHRLQGQYVPASDHYQRLLDLAHQYSNRNYQFQARQGLGRLQHATGHPDTALTYHRQALALAGELGQPGDQARAHDGLAHAHYALHQPEQARTHWQHALAILTRLGIDHTDEEETNIAAIRTHLANPVLQPPPGKDAGRWTMRWKPALNAFEMTFGGRLAAGCK
jgi:tetratricopeptide (TPR) repeat protein